MCKIFSLVPSKIGTPILKLAMVKRSKKGQKIHQKTTSKKLIIKFVKTIRQKNRQSSKNS